MGYEFLSELETVLHSNNVFGYVIKGSKTAGTMLLIFKIINTYFEDSIENKILGNRKEWLRIFIMFILILASDLIMTTIEQVFYTVNGNLNEVAYNNDILDAAMQTLGEQYKNFIDSNDSSWFDSSTLLANLGSFIAIGFSSLILLIIKIGDLSVTVGTLLVRSFMIQLMKFIFPIIVALSTLDSTKGLLMKWGKIYLAILLLGIIYIGVINFSLTVFTIITNSFINGTDTSNTWGIGTVAFGIIISGIVSFSLKVALFRRTTDFIIGFFT